MGSPSHLIVLQQSPFCNIDCRYCYLPDRANKLQMSPQVLELAFKKTLGSPVLEGALRYLWHAGEPLAAGKGFFREAFSIFDRLNGVYKRECSHSVQTNGTLIDDEWIDLFIQHGMSIGVSLDGPEFLHDQNRVMRGGRGTHARIMQSVGLLQSRGLEFGVIMVLTARALDHADEIFWFFVTHKIRNVAFNIDEIEGSNRVSSYEVAGTREKYRRFIRRFLCLLAENPNSLKVREIRSMLPLIVQQTSKAAPLREGNDTNTPLKILTINYKGEFSTFCPELSAQRDADYGAFAMGDLAHHEIEDIYRNEVFQKVHAGIVRGKAQCRATCDYWEFCLGGNPSNKFSESGSFESSETLHCRLHVKALVDEMVSFVEDRYLEQPRGSATLPVGASSVVS